MTIGQAIKWGAWQVRGVSDAPYLDVERILLATLSMSETAWLYAHPEQVLSLEQQQNFRALLAQRQGGLPLAYVLGQWDFFGRSFKVTPDTFIPRPLTEQLVEKAAGYFTDFAHHLKRPLVIADVCTGSGCIAITLALELSPAIVAQIVAIDLSSKALAVAQANAQTYGVSDRINFHQSDMLSSVDVSSLDALISNPPYLRSADIRRHLAWPTRQTGGLRFEPVTALDGGDDGDYFVEQLASTGLPSWVETKRGVQGFNLDL